ncbi:MULTISPECIES: hypothetical protein [unclassified Roseovarius]|uniref:hypothetical protein n=1 Tax=unclassified Roseovarius TaxID=2614913 RepID=UPI00273EDE8F|nr:hypothetical protein [Roseovarius sp. MMSF_3350]
MKYVIHLGVHRTASLLLQQNLSSNLDQLRAQGVFYVNAEIPKLVQRQIRMIRRRHKPGSTPHAIGNFAEINAAITDAAAQAGAQTVLISDEHRLGPSMTRSLLWNQPHPGFYPQAATNLQHVQAGLPLEQTRLLLYTRNAESYLLSLYSDAIRQNQVAMTLEQFCRSVNFNSINFHALEQELAALHPDLQVKSRQFERIKLGPETYLRSFLRDIGLDPAPFALRPTPPRPQLDAMQVEALLHIMSGTQSRRADMVASLREKVLRGAPNPLAPLVLPAWVTDSMRVTDEGRASDGSRTQVA